MTWPVPARAPAATIAKLPLLASLLRLLVKCCWCCCCPWLHEWFQQVRLNDSLPQAAGQQLCNTGDACMNVKQDNPQMRLTRQPSP